MDIPKKYDIQGKPVYFIPEHTQESVATEEYDEKFEFWHMYPEYDPIWTKIEGHTW